MARLSKVDGRWVNLDKPGGAVFFVAGDTVSYKGGGGSDTYAGTSPEKPKATIDGTTGAHASCAATRGDTIVVMPGTVTITAAIDLDVANVTLTGYTVTGPKTRNPSIITCATDSVSMINVDAANVVVENLTITNTATTADVFLIDVGDTTSASGSILRNLFIDCEGGAATVNAVRLGDGTVVSDYLMMDGCVIYDYDDIAVTQGTASDGTLIRNCDIFDLVSDNEGLTGIELGGDHCRIEDCYIKVSAADAAAACIAGTGTALENYVGNTHLHAFGSGAHGVLLTAGDSIQGLHMWGTGATADIFDIKTAVVGLTGFTGWAAVGDGSVCALINPNVTA